MLMIVLLLSVFVSFSVDAVFNSNAAFSTATVAAFAVDDDDDELVNNGNCDKCIPVVSVLIFFSQMGDVGLLWEKTLRLFVRFSSLFTLTRLLDGLIVVVAVAVAVDGFCRV